jgi:hypothetical protein
MNQKIYLLIFDYLEDTTVMSYDIQNYKCCISGNTSVVQHVNVLYHAKLGEFS